MSKKIRYFIEPLPKGKIRTWTIKCNKNKKFLVEYPLAKEVTKTEHDKAVLTLNNIFNANKANTI